MDKYQIIYADPPWPHRSGSRNKVVPYPVMKIQDICALPVSAIVEEDAVLFLWVTDKYLEKAIKVIKCWGFHYTTIGFTWVKRTCTGKLSLQIGSWTLKSTELCLLGVRGKPHKLLKHRKGILQLTTARRKGHSVKPSTVRKRIELMFGNKPKKIELFARQKTKGWDVWGDEVESDITL